jgi:hypothetical protein
MFDKRRIRKSGEAAQARVLSCEKRSQWTSNELRDYDYVLEVRPEGREPFQAKVRDKFWIAGLRPKIYDDVPVRFDPASLETVFDLDGDPRFDVDAMNAQTDEKRRVLREMQDAAAAGTTPPSWPGSPPAGAGGNPAPPAPDRLDELERLVRLRDAGALTESEFATEKARILGKAG